MTGYNYDAAGRLSPEMNAQHAATQYTYDAQGNVLVKPRQSSLWTYRYDETNQLIETRAPSALILRRLWVKSRVRSSPVYL